jgi:hypothetical protein
MSDANYSRWSLTLPGGTLDDEDVAWIVNQLTPLFYERCNNSIHQRTYLAASITSGDLGSAWVVPKGEYAGTFPKRLANYLRRTKVSWWKHPAPVVEGNTAVQGEPELIEQPLWCKEAEKVVAEIGARLGGKVNHGKTYHAHLRYSMDWKAGDYGDDGSCFWGGRSDARRCLNGRSSFRALCFETGAGEGKGRVLTITRHGYTVLFNAYGIELVTAARVLAHAFGATYSKVRLENNDSDSGLIYINSGTGYVVHPFDKAPAARIDLEISTSDYGWCDDCNEEDCSCERECSNCGSSECGECDTCNETSCECCCCAHCESNNWCSRCDRCDDCGRRRNE